MPTESAQLHLEDPEYGDLVFDAVVAGADDGEPVLLLHGWPQTAAAWARVIPPLASSGLRVAAVDQRGYSLGARPKDIEAYTQPRILGDAVGIIDALGWESAHIVGHDWGSTIGWRISARHPGMVRSLTALSTPHPRAMMAALALDSEQREKSDYVWFLREDPELSACILLRDDAAALRQVYGDRVHPHDVEAYVDFFSHDDAMAASLRWYGAINEALLDCPPVDVPVTYVWGTDDIAVGGKAARACGEHCQGPYEFRELPGRGHWLPDEDPDAVVDAILARVG